jgi:D-serine deaminase-like pyridoxal phosphate-dependent protein
MLRQATLFERPETRAARMNLSTLETPRLLLDEARMLRNVERMRGHLRSLGVALRPHVKTAKCIEAVRPAMETPQGPITVSTLKEADHFFARGVTDILYAVGITPNKLDHVIDLRRRGARLSILLDSVAAARGVADKSRASGERLDVLIEIDCDGHRSGVKPEAGELIEIGEVLAEHGAKLEGVMTHAGASYDCRSTAAIRAMAEEERAAAVRAAERLRAAGLACPVVSVGSTPTATFASDLTGVTEVRAGVFVFFDLVMAGLGVCRVEDIAVSVLTSVIGHQPEKGWIIVDAGWMAMSRDRGTATQPVDQGYGLVCDVEGNPLDDLIMVAANQEHGIIARRPEAPGALPDLPIGTLLRILPNHACATSAQHDRYHVVRDGQVAEVWQRFNGW